MRTAARVGLGLGLLLLLGMGAARLRFDVEVLNLLPERAPAVQGLKLYQEHFANAQELILTIEGVDRAGTEAAARSLAERLRQSPGLAAEVSWQPPWDEHPGETAELSAYLWFNQPPEVFAELCESLSEPGATARLEATRDQLAISVSPDALARLSYDPFHLLEPPQAAGGALSWARDDQIFVSAGGSFRLMFVEAVRDLRHYGECVSWLSLVRDVIERWHAGHPELAGSVSVNWTGRPVFVAEIAGGMERDINRSVAGTGAVIALLFGWAFRTWRPLVWLLVLLAFTLAATFALGGLVFGTLNVVSAGFAAILLGLAADYGLVLYQEHRAFPQESRSSLRRKLAPAILWSAASTACAFLLLNAGGLPGLGQLGTLVALGLIVAAVVMLYIFLPLVAGSVRGHAEALEPAHSERPPWGRLPALILTASALALFLWSAGTRAPGLDASPDALRPRDSQAYATLERIQERMERTQDPLWLIVTGDSARQTAARLESSHQVLEGAWGDGLIESVTLPVQFWPRPNFQEVNRRLAADLVRKESELMASAQRHGFTPAALGLTARMFETWREAASRSEAYWPADKISRWVFRRFTGQSDGAHLVLGLVYENPNAPPGVNPARTLAERLPGEGVWLASWEHLGQEVFDQVRQDLWRILIPMALLLLGMLALAFRRWQEVMLSLATLGFSGLGLWAVMGLLGWSWNLVNLMALPLLLGAGVDYSIHIQMALRRHQGKVRTVRRIVGRALLLCAATTFTAFSSLVFSSNAGLASLGQVCAAGIAITAVTAVVLLPEWWSGLERWGRNPGRRPGPEGAAGGTGLAVNETVPGEESSVAVSPAPGGAGPLSPRLYRAGWWQAGMAAARRVNSRQAERISRAISSVYWRCSPSRREVIVENLLPVAGGNRALAEQWSRELFENFAIKLADLFRYESGLPVDDLFLETTGWNHFLAARAEGRGVLLLTPHLGNWEFGAPLLARERIELLVITQPEPHARLTEVRQRARARRGIQTLVIGENPFAFVELIRRLEAGATVALLVDRPPAGSGVAVELFGRPFFASVAPAELARACGCALLPVYLPRRRLGYSAHMLPRIEYDRRALGTRQERARLTQHILRGFEPVLRQHITQWYQFTPVWPPLSGPGSTPVKS